MKNGSLGENFHRTGVPTGKKIPFIVINFIVAEISIGNRIFLEDLGRIVILYKSRQSFYYLNSDLYSA